MSSAGYPPPLPKLPLRDAIGLAYSSYVENFRDLLRASWLWILVVSALTGYAAWHQWASMATLLAGAKNGVAAGALPVSVAGLGFIASLLSLLAGVSIAVAWHRRIILGERPGLSGDNIFSGNLWRYVAVAIAMALISMMPLLAMAPLFMLFSTSSVALIVLAMFALYVIAIAITLRLSLLLPAQAVGDWGLTFRQSWQSTRGNAWRLFWGFVACTLPPYILLWIALAVLGLFPKPRLSGSADLAVGMTVISAIGNTIYLLIVPISIGFLSHAYRHFHRAAASS